MEQLRPLQKEPFHLVPIIPLAPLRGQLSYLHPVISKSYQHHIHRCTTAGGSCCFVCSSYQQSICKTQATKTPVTPCLRYHQVYILYHADNIHTPQIVEKHFYIGVTNLHKPQNLCDSLNFHIIKVHFDSQTCSPTLRWQTLELLSAHYSLPPGGYNEKSKLGGKEFQLNILVANYTLQPHSKIFGRVPFPLLFSQPLLPRMNQKSLYNLSAFKNVYIVYCVYI